MFFTLTMESNLTHCAKALTMVNTSTHILSHTLYRVRHILLPLLILLPYHFLFVLLHFPPLLIGFYHCHRVKSRSDWVTWS